MLDPFVCERPGLLWNPEISVFDASSWGVGVLSKTVGSETTQAIGRWNERWRFSQMGESGSSHRQKTFGEYFSRPSHHQKTLGEDSL